MHQIINSLLDIDLYKLSMGQAIYHSYSKYKTTWSFKNRNEGVKFTHEMVEEIKRQIKLYCDVRFTEEELNYLSSIEWIHDDYIDHLRIWKPRYGDFDITEEGPCGFTLDASGTWLNTSMYEIPVLAIINEVYFRMAYDYDELYREFKQKLNTKVERLKNEIEIGVFSEFGLRRRLSLEAQDLAVKTLVDNNKYFKGSVCVGTSNVLLAKKYNIVPVGTMAHEFIMCVGQGDMKYNPAYSNKFAMAAWSKEYGVLNGTYLTDTIGDECTHLDMGLTYSILFSGVRHDSGDPYKWADSWIEHYSTLYKKTKDERVNPKNKTLLFSDSLDFDRAAKIYATYKDKVKVAFGIGTYISNDTDVAPLNIVMKVTECNGHPVAKLSNDPSKGMCKSEEYIEYLRRTIDWRLDHHKYN